MTNLEAGQDMKGLKDAVRNARRHGIEDARTFADEHPEDVAGALGPGQLGADESLISAMGLEGTAKFFGVSPGTDAFAAACLAYNEAFAATCRATGAA